MKTTNYLAGLAAITMTFTGMAAPISAYADDSSSVSSTEYALYGDFVYSSETEGVFCTQKSPPGRRALGAYFTPAL